MIDRIDIASIYILHHSIHGWLIYDVKVMYERESISFETVHRERHLSDKTIQYCVSYASSGRGLLILGNSSKE